MRPHNFKTVEIDEVKPFWTKFLKKSFRNLLTTVTNVRYKPCKDDKDVIQIGRMDAT